MLVCAFVLVLLLSILFKRYHRIIMWSAAIVFFIGTLLLIGLVFRAIRDTGGVVGLNLYRGFVGGASMDALAAHVEHFLHLDGEKTLCIGGDLDGCEALAAGMNGAEDVPQLYEALEKQGYGKALLEDIFWNNLRRLL